MHVSNNVIVPVLMQQCMLFEILRKMTFQVSKKHLSGAFNSTLYCLNKAFLHSHCNKIFAVLDSMFVLLHFWHIVLKHPVYRKHLNRSNLDILKMKTYSFVSSLWSKSLYCAATMPKHSDQSHQNRSLSLTIPLSGPKFKWANFVN